MITFLVVNAILFIIALVLMVAEKYLITYGECSITINGDTTLDVDGGDNLLTYLNNHKIFIPSACGGKATCGFCKVKVLSGAGSILPTEEVFVTRSERAEGIRLACQVRVKQHVELYISEHLMGAEEFESEVVDLYNTTHDIKMLRLKILDGKRLRFKSGQYVQFKIPGTDEYRAYSIASPPRSDSIIDLMIRQVPGGLCSTYVHTALEEGDRVIFTGPFGDFFLQEESRKDIIAIGGGCGMAPIRSILFQLVEQGIPRRFYYFFGARSKEDLFFTEEFRELEEKYPNFHYIPALSEPLPADKWEGEVGFVTQTAEKYIDSERANEAYLCGPPPMINAAIALLTRKKVRQEDIYFDKF